MPHHIAVTADVATATGLYAALTEAAGYLGVPAPLVPLVSIAVYSLGRLALDEYRAWRAKKDGSQP